MHDAIYADVEPCSLQHTHYETDAMPTRSTLPRLLADYIIEYVRGKRVRNLLQHHLNGEDHGQHDVHIAHGLTN